MGHDIMGFNKKEEEVAYIQYSMSNPHAELLYTVLNAHEFNGGFSGSGESKVYNSLQIQLAIEKFKQINFENDEEDYEKNKLKEFLYGCFKTAQEEGKVEINFG